VSAAFALDAPIASLAEAAAFMPSGASYPAAAAAAAAAAAGGRAPLVRHVAGGAAGGAADSGSGGSACRAAAHAGGRAGPQLRGSVGSGGGDGGVFMGGQRRAAELGSCARLSLRSLSLDSAMPQGYGVLATACQLSGVDLVVTRPPATGNAGPGAEQRQCICLPLPSHAAGLQMAASTCSRPFYHPFTARVPLSWRL